MKPETAKHVLLAVAACLVALIAIIMLERQRAGLRIDNVTLAGSPVTLWRDAETDDGALVVVAHGYAGSRQMMQSISNSLARAGFVVAAFDFYGHGRHDQPMSGDVTSLDGATARLVEQTIAVTQAARDLPGTSGPTALVGHSMATDVIIRAAERMDDIAAVVAISMYSDAVEKQSPERLLIVSGAWEKRLRMVALDRLRQIDPSAGEGETVYLDDVARRAVAAPGAGHVGVLYNTTTLAETRAWISGAIGRPAMGELTSVALWPGVLLAALVALVWPVSLLSGRPVPSIRPGSRAVVLALVVPIAPGLAMAYLVPPGAFGLTAFAALTAFFAIWGTIQLALLWRAGLRPSSARLSGVLLLLLWGLCLFAPALDRYGAAFIPTGPRLPLMGLLMLGTVPFCLADALMTHGARWLTWLGVRILPVVTLFLTMLIVPRLGIAFTVLPVMVLFWCVYGLTGHWVRARAGPETSGLALGVILAWALAASTPMVAG